jgi:hypothetical protein
MAVDIATVGSLVAITKNLVDVFKGIGSFFGGGSEKAKLENEFKTFYSRIDVLALQLEQCERLTRSIPAWLELANRMPMWVDSSSMDTARAQSIDQDLRSLIHESIRDHFSATFFRSDFDKLPDVPLQLEIFRARLRNLDQTISTIQPGNVPALKALWSQITTQFNDARNTAWDIQRKAEDLQTSLIRELRDAAASGLKEFINEA